MQDFGQWLPQSQITADLYLSSMMSTQLDNSIEIQTRNSAVALLEQESAHPFAIRSAAGPIEVTRNDTGAIEDIQNGAGPTEVIDLNNTPPPKTKRKKHRPKVLRPPKASKSATPKPSKAKEEKPSGKRKYVRKNTPAGQPPPEQIGDSQCRSKPKPAKRCLNLDADVPQESRHPGSQAQLISADPKDYQPSESSTSQSNVQTQLPCHAGFTASSMYSSANQMAGAQLLPADNTETAIYSSANEMANAQFLPARHISKGVLLDLNSSTDQIQHEYANFVGMPEQFFQSRITETSQKDPLLEPRAGMPNKKLPDLNSSASLMQGMPSNFTEYLLSSPQASLRETHMEKQMLNCHRIPENPITTAQCSEGVAMRENFNPNPCSREAWATDQISYGYRSTQNPMSRPKHIEGHSMIENLSELTTIDDYLKFMPSSYMQTGSALGLHGSHGSSHMHALDTRGERNASSVAHISLGVNFDQQRNGWASEDVCHAATSRGSYLPETYKRMRTDNHSNCLNGGVDNISTPSMYLSNNRNTNVVSAINSNVFTLADAQRLIAREKSRASRGMISFGASGNNMVRRPEMIQHHHGPAMLDTACRDSFEASDNHFRLITENQLPSNPNTLQSQNHIPSIGSCQLHFLERNTVKGSVLPTELYKHSTFPQDDTRNSFCIGPSDELGRSINGKKFRSPVIPTTQSKGNDTLKVVSCQLESSGEVGRPLTNPINPSPGIDVLRNDNHQLEGCGETTAAKSSEKRKVGRPRKEIKPGEMPKPRGHPRKEKVIGPELKSKGSHTDRLQNEDICSVSGTHVAEASGFKELNAERSGESFPGVIAPLVDPLDLIIQMIKVLAINKLDDARAPEHHGALVPYKGEFGALVPYEGKVKRKRDRAKVNLDPVTALMWKLLMEPDMVDGSEGMDQDKEKWLDEERKIFRGRIDSFIARMHLVQGDRRFSPWKGSVVDSVVGVFLTQNVSDHLSSSAFMALAAKFPAKPEASRIPASRMFHTMPEENGDCSGLFGDSVKLQGSILIEEASNTAGSLVTTEEKEGSNSVGLFGNSPGDGVDCAGVYHNTYGTLPVRLHESKTLALGTESAVEAEDVALEDVVSSQNSAISSQSSPDYLFHMTDHMFPSTLINFTAEDFVGRNMPNGTSNSTTYTELLRMQELKSKPNEKNGSSQYDRVPVPCTNMGSMPSEVHNLSSKRQPLHSSVSYHQNYQAHLPDITYASDLERSVYSGLNRTDDSNVTAAETRFDCPSYSPGIDSDKTKMANSLTALLCDIDGSLCQHKTPFPSATAQGADFISPIMDKYFHPPSSETLPFGKEQSFEKNLSRNDVVAAFVKQHGTPNLQEECTTKANQIGGENHQSGRSQQYGNVGLPKNKDGSHYSSNLYQSEKANSELLQGVASSSIEKTKDTKKAFPEVPDDRSKTKKARVGARKKRTYDWDILRQEVLADRGHEERGPNAKDALDWETIRQINVKEISDAIRERGMNNMLSERIQEFLNRLVTDHGAIDLEWLRYVDPDKAKEYLLSIRGLGLKSVECVRLLTLHHMAFPVDTNVGRICVRLGWVPLQPLPESLQLHLLELYPMLENIQKYLWPRLCKLDQRTLYELHYQMITFGKVFCTKSKPNCNACPMRAECKHFASAFASARLALLGPEEKSLVASGNPIAAESCHQPYTSYRPVSQLDWNAHAHDHVLDNRQPIIEEPASPEPEPETTEIKESAIEDSFFDDPEEIPTIKLNFEEFAQNLKNYMQVNNIEIEDADMSSALVAITPEAASIPTPRLKNISRLRTEHQVYELPDSHPLLEGYDQREPDDPCPYLLSIWTPGETAQSTDAPKTSCNSHESGKLCDSSACFSCNSIREAQAQKVRGTILVPCRTAMRGSFPLNGTYFQVNEVFADHDSSRNPVDVPRSWIWDLPKRTVYFGTSVPSIFKGLTTEDIQHCFWRGFVCVRGFDRISRAPRPLYARLHFPASKLTRNKKAAAADDA